MLRFLSVRSTYHEISLKKLKFHYLVLLLFRKPKNLSFDISWPDAHFFVLIFVRHIFLTDKENRNFRKTDCSNKLHICPQIGSKEKKMLCFKYRNNHPENILANKQSSFFILFIVNQKTTPIRERWLWVSKASHQIKE